MQPTPSNTTWDQSALLQRARGKTERMEKMVRISITSIPEQVNQLKAITAPNQPCSEASINQIRSLAHALKGELGTMCATDAAEAAKTLENAILSGSTDQMSALIEDLDKECCAAVALFNNYLHE